jgi:hypothetical protein
MHTVEAGAAGVGVVKPLAALALLLSLAAPARGGMLGECERAFCRCISASTLGVSPEQLVQKQRDLAERVVLGRVVRIDSLAPHLVQHGPKSVDVRELAARVAVLRVWKGPALDTLTVVFGSTPIASSCDLTLLAGESYVIFATPWGDGALHTRQCTGTVAEVGAAATMAALGPGQALVK